MVGMYALYTDLFRHLPNMGNFLLWLETQFFQPSFHHQEIKERALECVLTPGVGNYGFGHAGNFAREAQKLNLPVFQVLQIMTIL